MLDVLAGMAIGSVISWLCFMSGFSIGVKFAKRDDPDA